MATERLTEERLGIIERQGGVACQVSVLSMIEEIRACRAGTLAPPGCVVVREEDLRALIVGVMNSDGSCCTCFPHDGECQPQHASCGESLLAHFGLEVTDGEAE